MKTTEERFREKYVVNEVTGCWEWTAYILPCGYGRFSSGGRAKYAHRVSYELHVSQIPEGLTLDHLCRVRRCVNPDHLEPVTQRENTLRGNAPTAVNAAKTHCPQRHEYVPENTFKDSKGRRYCRACDRAQSKARYQATRNPDAVANGSKTHCKRGHEFTPENTRITSNGGRDCRTCNRNRCRAYHRARRRVASAPNLVNLDDE